MNIRPLLLRVRPVVDDGRAAALLLFLISAGLILGAYYFQYVRHYLPCELCFWERKPHFALIALAPVAYAWRPARPYLLLVLGLVALGNAGLALFHVGVEEHWWPGLSTCSSPAQGVSMTAAELRKMLMESTVVPCDRAVWWFLGLSMAAWNGIASLCEAIIGLAGGAIAWRNRAK